MKHLLFLICLLSSLGSFSFAQIWTEETKIVASDREEDEGFGHAVARTGDLAVISAIYEDEDENGANPMGGAGAAYIFERQSNGTWVEVQKIVASDRNGSDRFGQSVAILGTTIIVGAEEHEFDLNGENDESKAGAVYIFEKQADGFWDETQKIVAQDRNNQSYFGCSVAAYGDYLVIGAEGDTRDANGENPVSQCGSAYVYKLGQDAQWVLNKKLTPIIRRYHERFGCDVAIHKKRIVIGAFQDAETSSYPERGAAYVFELDIDDEWMPIQKILPTSRSKERFGWSVDLNDELIIVGAYMNWATPTYLDSETGAAYAFEKNKTTGEWNQTVKFVKSDPKQSDHFGYDVAIDNSYLVISGRRVNISRGEVYVFNYSANQWKGLDIITCSSAEAGDYFGTAVDIWNGKILVGAVGEDHDLEGNNKMEASGAAFFYTAEAKLSEPTSQIRTNAIFPNPSTGDFTMTFDQLKEDITIEIIDLNGKKVFEQSAQNTNHISVKSTLQPGLYLVRSSLNGTAVSPQKLIITNN